MKRTTNSGANGLQGRVASLTNSGAKSTRNPQAKPSAGAGSKPSPSTSRLRMIIADDHVLIRDLVSGMVTGDAGCCEVVAEVGTAADAITACKEFLPDILLLDINMPGRSGVDAVPDIKRASPKTRILLCCGTVTERELLAALQAGAEGFMEKTGSPGDLLNAIAHVGRGESYLCRKSINTLSKVLRNTSVKEAASASGAAPLTAREREIIGLIAGGRSSKEIATKLFLSLATVETHRSNLMTKIQAHNVAQLVRYAHDHGLVTAER